MSQPAQADLVWRTLFVENTPVSEAARGVVTVLDAFGLDTAAPDLTEAREFFRAQDPAAHLERVFELAGVSDVAMTNDPFDAREASVWEGGANVDGRFHAALRMDGLLNDWGNSAEALAARGYEVDRGMSGATVSGGAALPRRVDRAHASALHGRVAARRLSTTRPPTRATESSARWCCRRRGRTPSRSR